MTKKENINRVGSFIKVVVFIGLIIAMIFWFNSCTTIDKAVLDEPCQAYGYNKSTDYNYGCDEVFLNHCPNYPNLLSIECDGEIVFNACRIRDECKEYDKWGNCIKETKTDISCWSIGTGEPLYLFHSKWEGVG